MLHLDVLFPLEAREKYGSLACFPVDDYFHTSYDSIKTDVHEYAKYIIREIDKSELISDYAVDSPVLNIIPIYWISSGAKNLILMSSSLDLHFHLDFMGDSCFRYLLDLAATKDIYASISIPERLYGVYFPTPIMLCGKLCQTYHDMYSALEE